MKLEGIPGAKMSNMRVTLEYLNPIKGRKGKKKKSYTVDSGYFITSQEGDGKEDEIKLFLERRKRNRSRRQSRYKGSISEEKQKMFTMNKQ